MNNAGMNKKIAMLSPVAWRTPPRCYGAWETVASNITEGLVARGWDVTLFATADSITNARLQAIIPKGYEEDKSIDPKVVECLHISEVMERADEFDLIHNNYGFLPLTYSRLINTPMLTTIHGFSSPQILDVYHKYRDRYFVSISDDDRDPGLPYLATVYNGIAVDDMPFFEKPGDNLVWLGRIHPDKGVDAAIETAKQSGMNLIMAGIVQDQEYFDTKVKPHINDTTVKYIGPVNPEQRSALFKQASALLHLHTIPERFGLVIVEAMAAGVPVIAMDLGSPREIITDGKDGCLVTSVAEAVATVKNVFSINRKACRKTVEKRFSIDAMVADYEEVYQQIFEMGAKKQLTRSIYEPANCKTI